MYMEYMYEADLVYRNLDGNIYQATKDRHQMYSKNAFVTADAVARDLNEKYKVAVYDKRDVFICSNFNIGEE